MAPKTNFRFCENSHVTEIWKTTFPMEFFNKIWLKVGKHEYFHIFVSPELSSVRDYVLTHSVRSM